MSERVEASTETLSQARATHLKSGRGGDRGENGIMNDYLDGNRLSNR